MSSPSADTAARADGPNASANVGAAIAFASTEHFNLQTARAATVSEANGIFNTSDEQREVAEDTIADIDASGLWPGKVVTEISAAGPF